MKKDAALLVGSRWFYSLDRDSFFTMVRGGQSLSIWPMVTKPHIRMRHSLEHML